MTKSFDKGEEVRVPVPGTPHGVIEREPDNIGDLSKGSRGPNSGTLSRKCEDCRKDDWC